VELRNARWFDPQHRERTLRFLDDHRIPFVMVDEPQGLASSVPPLLAVPSEQLAMIRFHGRRVDTWERPNVSVAVRFRYLYDRDELAEWIGRIAEAAGAARETHVIMNNCYANYGTTNAAEMAAMLEERYRPSSTPGL
jgi:uncharacterized protein YecE (DUF72 family)